MEKKIAILIPCYNEEVTIGKVIQDFRKELPKADIYVYDNNSTDRTSEIAKQNGAIVRKEKQQGKGNVVRSMFRDIEADCYIMVDGDDTYPAKDAKRLSDMVLKEGVDMAIGDRLSNNYLKENNRQFHNMGNLLFRFIVNELYNGEVPDILTGYRALSRQFVKGIEIEAKRFEIEAEMTIYALNNDLKIKSIPIQYQNRPKGSKSKLKTFSDGFKILFFIIKKYLKNISTLSVLYYILTYIFTLTFTVGLQMAEFGNSKNINEEFIRDFKFDFKLFIITFVISIPVYILIKKIIELLSQIKIKASEKKWNLKKLRIFTFMSIFITSMIFLLTYYPGANMIDDFHSMYLPIRYSNQYPLFYNLTVSTLYRLFYGIFGSMNFSLFLLGVLQIIFMDCCITHVIMWFYKKFNTQLGTTILLIYFNCVPMITNYNFAQLRDSFFAGFFLLLMPCLYEIIETKGKCLSDYNKITKIAFIMSCGCLSRNNAIYICIFIIAYLLINYSKYYKNLLLILIGFIFVNSIPNFILDKMGVHQLFQEKIAYPIQQLAYVTKYEGLPKEDEEFLSQIMSTDRVIELYNPRYVDKIKWSWDYNREYLNEHKLKYMYIWLKNMPSHFEGYVKAYLYASYDLWAIHEADYHPDTASRFLGLETRYLEPISWFHNIKHIDVFPQFIQEKLEKFYEKTTIFFNNATLFWIMLLFMFVVGYKKHKELLLLFLPLLGNWLTLIIASPISMSYRYMCIFGYLLPIVILISFIKLESQKDLKE